MRLRIARGLLSIALILTACGRSAGAGSGPSATPTPAMPTAVALTAVADQVFPLFAKYGYYVECINLKENGAAVPGGNDYSACPITDSLRARMVQTQAHFCPCEQNP